MFPEYNLHLPPKHFLSTGVDIPVIQERCVLLDEYIKVKRHVSCFLLSVHALHGSLYMDFVSFCYWIWFFDE